MIRCGKCNYYFIDDEGRGSCVDHYLWVKEETLNEVTWGCPRLDPQSICIGMEIWEDRIKLLSEDDKRKMVKNMKEIFELIGEKKGSLK